MEAFYKKRLRINIIGKLIMYVLVIGNVVTVNVFMCWQFFVGFLLIQIMLFSLIDSFNDCIKEYRKLLFELQFKNKDEIK